MRKKVEVLVIAICFTVLACAAVMAGPEGFSGNWALDKAKSDFSIGQGGETPDITMKVEASKDSFKVSQTFSSSRGEMTMEQTYIPDDQEHEVAGIMGSKGKATAKWDGEKLVVKATYSAERDGQEMKWTDSSTWELSSDGSLLTIQSTFESQMGSRTGKRVFAKK